MILFKEHLCFVQLTRCCQLAYPGFFVYKTTRMQVFQFCTKCIKTANLFYKNILTILFVEAVKEFHLSPFAPNAPFLYPLKTLKTLRFLKGFWQRKSALGKNGSIGVFCNFKVRLSSSKKDCFISFNKNTLKMMKNVFYFMLSLFSFSRCLNFCCDFLVMQKKLFDQRDKVNITDYDITTWIINNQNTRIVHYLTK